MSVREATFGPGHSADERAELERLQVEARALEAELAALRAQPEGLPDLSELELVNAQALAECDRAAAALEAARRARDELWDDLRMAQGQIHEEQAPRSGLVLVLLMGLGVGMALYLLLGK